MYMSWAVPSAPFSLPQWNVTASPAFRSTTSPASGPMRSFGPGRSCSSATGRPARPAASRTHSAVSACSSWEPWLKFSRATSIPASTMRPSVSRSRDAGPIVATIFVLRSTSRSVSSARSVPVHRRRAMARSVVNGLEQPAPSAADHDLAGHVSGADDPELAELLADEVGRELRRGLGAGPIGERGDRDEPAVAGVEHLVPHEPVLVGEDIRDADVDPVHEVVHGPGGHPVLTDDGVHAVAPFGPRGPSPGSADLTPGAP